MKTHINQYVTVDDFVELFESSKKRTEELFDRTDSKAEYLMMLMDFHTYDAALDEFYVGKIVEVLEALLKRKTFDYIGASEENNRWYTIILNLPFFKDRVSWGGSIRGAWLEVDHKTLTNCIKSCFIIVNGKQVLKFELDCDRWKAFCQAMIDFYRKPT